MTPSRAVLTYATLVTLTLLCARVGLGADAPPAPPPAPQGEALPQEQQQPEAAGEPQAAPPKAKGKVGKLPHVSFDPKKRQVRVDCEALAVESPLEFFCVKTGTSEHESVLRSPVTPSDLHTALLAVGLEPGRPVTYSNSLKKWLPPRGAPLHISIEWTDPKSGKAVAVPAHKLMRNVKTKKPMPTLTWVFAGSRVMNDGKYAADVTGYIVSVVNFDLTMIDIPEIKTNANETLEWERNPDTAPPGGTKVVMVIEPVGGADDAGGGQPADAAAAAAPPGDGAETGTGTGAAVPDAGGGGEQLSDVQVDQKRVEELRGYWLKRVHPHANALRDAAQAHYKVIESLRDEQNRLIEESDRLGRVIEQLEKEYQDMTTPRGGGAADEETEAPAEGEGAAGTDAGE